MKVVPAIKQFLGLPAVTKSQSGFLIALVAIITVVGKVTIENVDVLCRNQAVVCIGLGVAGFVSWLGGRLGQRNRVKPGRDQSVPVDPAVAVNPLEFFTSLTSWGVIFVLSAAILSYLTEARQAAAPVLTVHARPRTEIVIAATNAVTITNEARKVSFPLLKLLGIVVNGAKSSALINGQVLYVGERFGDVTLVAVKPEYVTVELKGQTKWLVLGK